MFYKGPNGSVLKLRGRWEPCFCQRCHLGPDEREKRVCLRNESAAVCECGVPGMIRGLAKSYWKNGDLMSN